MERGEIDEGVGGSGKKEVEWVDWLDEYRKMKEAKLKAEEVDNSPSKRRPFTAEDKGKGRAGLGALLSFRTSIEAMLMLREQCKRNRSSTIRSKRRLPISIFDERQDSKRPIYPSSTLLPLYHLPFPRKLPPPSPPPRFPFPFSVDPFPLRRRTSPAVSRAAYHLRRNESGTSSLGRRLTLGGVL